MTWESVATEALKLDPRERAAVAESLLLSLPEPHQDEIGEELIKSWQKRGSELAEGRIQELPAEQVLKQIRNRLG